MVVSEWCGESIWTLTSVILIVARNSVELVEHMFCNFPLGQQVWCYVANIMWRFIAKRGNLSPWELFSTLQCLLDQPFCKPLKQFNCIWFFFKSGLLWITWKQWNDLNCDTLPWPMEKVHQVVWDSLQDYGRIEWQRSLTHLEKNPHILPMKMF